MKKEMGLARLVGRWRWRVRWRPRHDGRRGCDGMAVHGEGDGGG